ncbi:MAG TPA: cytochrome C oxidase subunit IV family protein [Bacteroidota bacterium]
MSEAHSVEAVRLQVRRYYAVFAGLLGLTIVTVTISYFHLSAVPAIIAALFVASIKGSLVASYFMHLISERKFIYFVLILTAVFFLALMLLPVMHHADRGAV